MTGTWPTSRDRPPNRPHPYGRPPQQARRRVPAPGPGARGAAREGDDPVDTGRTLIMRRGGTVPRSRRADPGRPVLRTDDGWASAVPSLTPMRRGGSTGNPTASRPHIQARPRLNPPVLSTLRSRRRAGHRMRRRMPVHVCRAVRLEAEAPQLGAGTFVVAALRPGRCAVVGLPCRAAVPVNIHLINGAADTIDHLGDAADPILHCCG